MANNKIPLALGFDPATNVNTGLEEFVLNLSDAADVCTDAPSAGQALIYNSDGQYCPSTLPAPGEFTGNLSDVGQVCSATPEEGQALVWSGTGVWCPSTIPTGGGGGGVTSINGDTGPAVDLYLSSLSGITFTELGGGLGEGDGLLPQHLQWNGTNWVNAYEDEQYIRIKNRSGSELKAGQVVHIFNFQGDQAEVSLARADSPNTMPSIGVVYSNILTDETGLAVTFGTADVDNSLTIDGSPNVGDVLYVSPTTSGSLTAIKPTGSSHLIQNVGVLLKAGSGAKVKVTGVGRANDIPNTLTLGATTITSASAKFANVDADHILISDSASATSSVASATLFSQGITDNNIVTSVNSQTGPSVTLDADDIGDTATTNKFATRAQLDKVDYLSVTAPINLDSIPAGNLQDTYLTSLAGVNPSDLDTGTSVSDGQLVKRVKPF
jgi:hypothetical protein